MLLRESQVIEYVYDQMDQPSCSSGDAKAHNNKGKGKGLVRAGILEERDVFAGTHRAHGELMVSPELLDYVAKEVGRDAE
eukprot:11166097-Lingulodinium_polyedra.AAC.1